MPANKLSTPVIFKLCVKSEKRNLKTLPNPRSPSGSEKNHQNNQTIDDSMYHKDFYFIFFILNWSRAEHQHHPDQEQSTNVREILYWNYVML